MRRQKPVFSICAEHLLHLRAAHVRAAHVRAAHVRGAAGRSRPCHLNFYRRHEGVCLWLASRAGPFFIWQKEEAFL